MYVIWDTTSSPEEPLYWSNVLGWCDRDSADLFTEAERNALTLPMDGTWLQVELPD